MQPDALEVAVGVLAATVGPDRIDVPDPGGVTGTQWLFGLAVMAAVAAGLLIAVYRLRYHGLPDEQQSHKASILASKWEQTPLTYRIPAPAFDGGGGPGAKHRANVRETLEAALDRRSPETGRVTVRAAAAELNREVTGAIADRFDGVPRMTIIALELGIATLVAGAVAVSTDTLVALLTGEGDGPSVVALLTEITVTVATTGFDALGAVGRTVAFPWLDVIWAFVLIAVVDGARLLYESWLVLGLLLLGTAVAISRLDKHVPDDVEIAVTHSLWDIPARVVATIIIAWVLGVFPAALGRLTGADILATVGALVGFLAAAVFVLYRTTVGTYRYTRALYYRIRRQQRTHDLDRWLAAYALTRRLAVAMMLAVVPVLPVWVGVAVFTGRATRVAGAITAAPPAVQATLGVLAVGIVAVLAYVGREAWPDLRAAVVESFSRARLRAAVFQRGLPYAAVGVGYVIVYGFVGDIAVAATVAVLAGVLVYATYVVAMRARHSVSVFEMREMLPQRVMVEVFSPEDGSGERRLLVRLNGDHELAFDDVDEVTVDTVLDVADDVARPGEPDPTVAAWRARDMQQYGLVESEYTRSRLRNKVRWAVLDPLRDDGAISTDERERRCEDYPPSVWHGDGEHDGVRANLLQRDIISISDGVIYLEQDPYRKEQTRSTSRDPISAAEV